MVGRHEGGWNPSVIVNPNFDFAVRHQAASSVSTKAYSGEEGVHTQSEGWTSRSENDGFPSDSHALTVYLKAVAILALSVAIASVNGFAP